MESFRSLAEELNIELDYRKHVHIDVQIKAVPRTKADGGLESPAI